MQSWLLFKLLRLPVEIKTSAFICIDFIIVFISNWVAYSLKVSELTFPASSIYFIWIVYGLLAVLSFYVFGLYRVILRYANVDLIWMVIKAIVIYSIIGLITTYWLNSMNIIQVPLTTLVVQAGGVFFGVTGFRYLLQRFVIEAPPTEKGKFFNKVKKKVIIYGAGEAGFQIAQGLRNHRNMHVCGFVDDDLSMQNQSLCGVIVYSSQDIELLVKNFGVSEILLALPSASRVERERIIQKIEPLPVLVRTLPDLASIVSGKVKVEDIREVDIADLVGRTIVPPIQNLLTKNIHDKTVLVTGAGGSIGAELCRQVSKLKPKLLILFEQNEFNLYAIDQELKKCQFNYKIVLGSIIDSVLLTSLCKEYMVQTIFHAAAYKHVPLVESNPFAGVYNNTLGTLKVANVAIESEVETFVLISTDKAVNPANIMGASKRFAEQILQALNHKHKHQDKKMTQFVMVRFGNVLGSSGSVLPLFRQQIKQGGPVTVTHKDITRYFMTIPEAAQLVIQAGSMGKGGDVFVLDMGKPIKIIDLVVRMINLSGLTVKDESNVDGDIEIKISGLRPGEKLYEELLIGNNVTKTRHERIFRAQEVFMEWELLQEKLKVLQICHDQLDYAGLDNLLHDVIDGYEHNYHVKNAY